MKPFREIWDPIYEMARCDFKLRDQGTVFGLLWTMVSPALLFTLIYLIFSQWFGKIIHNFGWHLLIGLIQWNFFSSSTTNALTVFERKRYLVRNFAFDKVILPVGAVLSVFASFLFENIVMLLILGFTHGFTFVGLLLFIGVIFCNLALSICTSLFLSALNVFFRDIRHIWGLVLRIGFFATPIFYPLQIIDAKKLFFLKLNPLYHVLRYARDSILRGTVYVGPWLAYMILSTVLIAIASYIVFRKSEPLMPEYL